MDVSLISAFLGFIAKIIPPLGKAIMPRIKPWDITVKPVNAPPFAIAFESNDIRNQYIGINFRDIPLSDETIWVDKASLHVGITNNDSKYDIQLCDIQLQIEEINNKWQSALQYIPQGAKRSLRFQFDLSKELPTASRVEIEFGEKTIENDYFIKGDYVQIKPGETEWLILTFIKPQIPITIKPLLVLRKRGKEKQVGLATYQKITLIPQSILPKDNLQWTIHLDGRASGEGFQVSNYD